MKNALFLSFFLSTNAMAALPPVEVDNMVVCASNQEKLNEKIMGKYSCRGAASESCFRQVVQTILISNGYIEHQVIYIASPFKASQPIVFKDEICVTLSK